MEKPWEEVVMAQFKALSQHLTVGSEEIYKNFDQDSWSLG
jgi:hypothetical protein